MSDKLKLVDKIERHIMYDKLKFIGHQILQSRLFPVIVFK